MRPSFDRQAFTLTALNPHGSVVVEACAGSGKTWLLVSRMLRILLTGVAPGKVLAITFTRKAASEIQSRLRDWLAFLAEAPEPDVLAFLRERGLTVAEAEQSLPRARSLFETTLQAQPGMTVTTFHGWFHQILSGAPLDTGFAGFSLLTADAPLREEALVLLGRQAARQPQGTVAQHLQWLLREYGQHNVFQLLNAFLAVRAEFHTWRAGIGPAAEIATLPPEQDDPRIRFLQNPLHRSQLAEYAGFLSENTTRDQAWAKQLSDGLSAPVGEAVFEQICDVILTKEGAPRKRDTSAAQAKRLMGAAREATFLTLHDTLAAAVQEALAQYQDQCAWELNAHALAVGEALLKQYEALKTQRKLHDYADLEWKVAALLEDGERAPYLQARMDARYRHILLDEFQDTNPLQWRILLAWLGAYEGNEAGQPRIFMVGDPKQSIYRFRRADVRIFEQAAQWLTQHAQAQRLPNDVTFRNAPKLVDVVNALFSAEPAFEGFRPQHAEQQSLPGGVTLLPLIRPAQFPPEEEAPTGLRNPLLTPDALEEDLRRREEALAMIATLQTYVGQASWVDSAGRQHPLRWDDVMILTRRRSILPVYEQALREAGIAYFTASRGGLLGTLEAQDMLAILRFLASPANDLALMHALRTPVFDCSDPDLLFCVQQAGDSAWAQLGASIHLPDAPASLIRAHDLLSGWLALAPTLPVHEVLDAVFHQGGVMSRYPARVPPAMWPGVKANLEAFMALSLEVDSGRYPSLTRFVDELHRLQSASDEEAPDEGMLTAQAETGRLRILTVHGAKGLEAPLVWLIDAHSLPRADAGYTALLDWPPADPHPAQFVMLASRKTAARSWQPLLAQEDMIRAREQLNLLYVAMTRARHYFFASGIAPRRNSTQITDYQRLQGALRRCLGILEPEHDSGEDRVLSYVDPLPTGAVSPTVVTALDKRPRPVLQGEPLVAQKVSTEEESTCLGIAVHAYLQMAAPAHMGQHDGAWRALMPVEQAAAQPLAEAILNHPDWQHFFNPALYDFAANERTYVSAQGQLGRIDRVVEREDAVWLLDYKTGAPDPERLVAYRGQLQRYRTHVATQFGGKPVRCLLLFSDGTALEVD